MRLAILIHVHKNPEQVARLVSRLRHNSIDVYINIDAKTDATQFKNIISDVYYIKDRVEVAWGRFSQVQQMLNSFKEIVSSNRYYSHVLFISGQDYPLKPVDDIIKAHTKEIDKNFINYYHLGSDNSWSCLMKKRYEYWHFLPSTDWRSNVYVKKFLQKIGFKRKFPFEYAYYGACWFSLTMESVRYLLDFTTNHPQVVKFFEHSGCSDELYIQSVLLNSPLKDKMVNKIYRFFDWSDEGKSPRILTVDDLDKIKDSDVWFARKFDSQIDSQILDKLDELN